tara:strand:+ start:217 stop:615 length:399 start_codon:yes stop_codon:yes gene_type:complete
MIDALGGMIPFLCHVFLIFFAGFFSLNFIFNKNFTKSFGFESAEASFMGRPLGFVMLGVVLMLIATLFQINGFNSTSEIYAVLFIFALLGFLNNLLMYLRVIESPNDSQQNIKNSIRPLIVLIVIIISVLSG